MYFKNEVDTVAKTVLLEYKIRYTNLSNFDVKGYPQIYLRNLKDPEVTYTGDYLEGETLCHSLASKNYCETNFSDKKPYNAYSTDPDGPGAIEIAKVEYIITK